MKEFIVNSKFNNRKLQNFIYTQIPSITSYMFYKTLRKKDIKVNDIRINENIILHEGDNIKVYIDDKYLSSSFTPDIIYEDKNILIINKPAGIEVVGENSLTNNLINYYKSSNNKYCISPCHRLDRNTTGLILYAKNEEALNTLLKKFKNHEIEKHYKAMVYGIPHKKTATLNAYLFKDNKKSLVYISDTPKKGYVPIETKYNILKYDIKKNFSILDVELLTGKTHQIRAHLAHIGYPIIGDGKYGKNEINKKFGHKVQQLCSYKLKFNFFTDSGILNYLDGKEFILNKNLI